MTSTQTGGTLSCGSNGETIQGTASEQVGHIVHRTCITLIDILDDDRNAVNTHKVNQDTD
jgi:hypothetical protein